MLGGSRTVGSGTDGVEKLKFYEFLRISVQHGDVLYHAAPMGRSPAPVFTMVEQSSGRVVFENKANDFPKRVIYYADGDETLHATIEDGSDDGRAQRWTYERYGRAR